MNGRYCMADKWGVPYIGENRHERGGGGKAGVRLWPVCERERERGNHTGVRLFCLWRRAPPRSRSGSSDSLWPSSKKTRSSVRLRASGVTSERMCLAIVDTSRGGGGV